MTGFLSAVYLLPSFFGLATFGVIATFTSSRHDTSPQLVQRKCG